MKYRLKAYSIWEFGKRVENGGIPHQEDSIFPAHKEATDSDRLFILCDGMGGHDAGEVASGTVCETLSETIRVAVPDPEGEFPEEVFQTALQNSFNALDAKDSGEQKKKMGTTMTLLKFHSGGYFAAHIGDSRIYQIRPGKTREETKIVFMADPHSLVYELVKAGELTPEEARHSNQKNIITRAMQPHMEKRSKADIHVSTDIRPGDYFYMCSDGMLENMDNEQLCYFFSDEAGDDERKVSLLTRATQENRDNHSAIIIHILDVIDPIPQVSVSDNDSYVLLEGEVHDEPKSQPLPPPRPPQVASANVPRPQTAYHSPKGGNNSGHRKNIVGTICLIVGIVIFIVAVVCAGHKLYKTLHKQKPQDPVPAEKTGIIQRINELLVHPADSVSIEGDTTTVSESAVDSSNVNNALQESNEEATTENDGETESQSEVDNGEQEEPANLKEA